MSDWIALPLALAGGFGAGLVFFGGLWLTVRRLATMSYPALVIVLSSLVRLAFALTVFWWCSRGELRLLLLCLIGFLGARALLIKAVRPVPGSAAVLPTEERKPCT